MIELIHQPADQGKRDIVEILLLPLDVSNLIEVRDVKSMDWSAINLSLWELGITIPPEIGVAPAGESTDISNPDLLHSHVGAVAPENNDEGIRVGANHVCLGVKRCSFHSCQLVERE